MEKGNNDVSLDGLLQICNKTKDNIFVYSIEGVCLYTNTHLSDIFKTDPVGKHLRELFPHRSEEHIQKIIDDYKKIWKEQKGDIIPTQKELFPDGERVFSVTREPITWNNHPAIAGIGKDITDLFLAREEAEKAKEEITAINEELAAINDELKSTNDKLEDKNKQLGEASDQLNQFIRHVLHDIKNPAGSIVGFIELITSIINEIVVHNESDEKRLIKIKYFFDIIKTSSKKIQIFLADLGQYQKLKKGNLKLEIEQIEIKSFFDNIIDQQYGYLININQQAKYQRIKEKNINLVLDNSIQQLPNSFLSDKKLLERIFTNLIGNAIKFTDEGSITIAAQKIGQYIRFSVTDTGIGIDQKDHDIVFNEFQYSSTVYTPVIEGSGLGLPIVTKIINELGGKMLPLKSELGKGSTFSFELPLELKMDNNENENIE